jgi:predicted CXXCH cytochrome family protein
MNSGSPTRRRFCLAAGFVAAAIWGLAATWGSGSAPRTVIASSQPEAVVPLENPDAVCAQCHREIYEKYRLTPMARGGGVATEGLLPGSFHHKPSAIDYRIFLRDGSAWMSYTRPAGSSKGALSGELLLQYFIGSGQHGRTYLYRAGSEWFELPVNYYTRRSQWDMAPAYDNVTNMPAPLPVDPNCLHCHSSEGQPSLSTARNSFVTQPFRQGGVGCSGCHGDPAAHLAQHGHGPITNPDKLDPARRDSACVQCHLEGDAVVYRPGRSLAQFVPGDNLSDIAVYFVRASQQTGGARATSQYEALLHSACKRAAGDKLTCTTCHDPHFDPPPAERVQYFRERCLSCHTGLKMETHHREQPDCATCHMPARNTVDISHEQVTDHDIERRPGHSSPRITDGPEQLVAVGGFAAGDREYGLAYAQLAQRNLPGAAELALQLLNKAANAGASDRELHDRLGYLNQVTNNLGPARAQYAAALQLDAYDSTALANLAVIDASTGHLQEAIHLLETLVAADPSQTAVGLNLAFIDCKLNRTAEARAVIDRIADLNPDDPQLREFVEHATYAGQHCSLSRETAPVAKAAH